MPTLLFGVLVLVLVLWGLHAFSKADPQVLGKVLRRAGGIIALALAGFLGVRGRFEIALPLGMFALGLLGWLPGMAGIWQRTRKTPGQVSRVRAPCVEMELDHDSGHLAGRILCGSHDGVALDALDVPTLIGLLAEFDEESGALIAAYLDRREPGWREDSQAGAAAGQGNARSSGKMTQEEAYQVLGLEAGANADAITRAHRTLMKKLHPDQGGSTYLAARVNEAKDILLRRHR